MAITLLTALMIRSSSVGGGPYAAGDCRVHSGAATDCWGLVRTSPPVIHGMKPRGWATVRMVRTAATVFAESSQKALFARAGEG